MRAGCHTDVGLSMWDCRCGTVESWFVTPMSVCPRPCCLHTDTRLADNQGAAGDHTANMGAGRVHTLRVGQFKLENVRYVFLVHTAYHHVQPIQSYSERSIKQMIGQYLFKFCVKLVLETMKDMFDVLA